MNKNDIFYIENESYDVTNLGSSCHSKVAPIATELQHVIPSNGKNGLKNLPRNKSIAEGTTLSCHDINYEVDVRTGFFPCIGKSEKRLILKNIK